MTIVVITEIVSILLVVLYATYLILASGMHRKE